MNYINDILYSIRDNMRDEVNILQLQENVRNYYYYLYSYYSDMLIKFLIKYTKIKEYDKEIESSDLKFVKIENNNKDFYQKICKDLNFYYIRNNMYLYRLTHDENEFLKRRLMEENYILDDSMEIFIKNTLKKIICEDIKSDDKLLINFGPREGNRFASNNSLVIGFKYDYSNNGLEDKEWYENYKKQQIFMIKQFEELTKNISENLNYNVSIFQYDDYSVKKQVHKQI